MNIQFNRILFLWIILSGCVIQTCTAQKVVQLETRGKIRTQKFFMGEELSVMLDSEDFWRHTRVLDIDLDEQTIEFEYGSAHINEIGAIKTPAQRARGKNWRNKLLLSSAGFLIYAPLEIIYQDDPNWPLIAGGLGLGVVGVILKPIFDQFSKHNLGKRKRLRLLDLSLPDEPYRP